MIRVILNEKKAEHKLVEEKFWQRRDEFLALNPAGNTPVLLLENGEPIAGFFAIAEYLEEKLPGKKLLPKNLEQKAEVRRLIDWFGIKIYLEVSKNLLGERFFKRKEGVSMPNTKALAAGRRNILYHMDYIEFLTEDHNWLVGDELSMADIIAACQFSCLDFFGDVPWNQSEKVKHWYQMIKCRPSFRVILEDKIPGLSPSPNYKNLDF